MATQILLSGTRHDYRNTQDYIRTIIVTIQMTMHIVRVNITCSYVDGDSSTIPRLIA